MKILIQTCVLSFRLQIWLYYYKKVDNSNLNYLNLQKLRTSPALEKLYYRYFSDGCINTHNKLHVKIGEATKKVPHKLCKNKRFKKNIYIFYSKHISLKTTTSKKISLSLSLSQNIISNCLKKFILVIVTVYCILLGQQKIQHQKKTKTTYHQILRKSYLSLNISIKLFLLRIRKHIK